MAMPITGPNDPRLPKHYTPNGHFDPKSPGGPDLEGPGFRWLGNNHNGNGGGDPTGGLLSAFLPGQKSALAQQLNAGFGGGPKQWNGILSQAYSNMHIPANPLGYPAPDPKNDGRGGDDGTGGDKNGDGKPDVTGGDDGYNPGDGGFNPHSSIGYLRPGMQMQNPQMLGANPMISGPMMPSPMQPQMQPPTSMQPGMGQQTPQGLSPQVMAMLRARFGGR